MISSNLTNGFERVPENKCSVEEDCGKIDKTQIGNYRNQAVEETIKMKKKISFELNFGRGEQ